MNILLLGARAPACLEWSRAFAASDCRVYVADSLALPVTRFSRACHRYFRLPAPNHDPAMWISVLADIVQRHKIDWLVPTCEEVFYLAWGMPRLPPRCRVFTSAFALLGRLHHKGSFAEFTRQLPISAPATRLLTGRADVDALRQDAPDLVFKPAYSRFGVHTLLRPQPQQLASVNASPAHPWVAQQFVAGRELCSFSLLHSGVLAAHTCYHPRYRAGRGAGVYFDVVTSAAIEDFVRAFGAVTGYTGQVGFDLIEGSAGLQVVECNPRATSGVHLLGSQPRALTSAVLDARVGDVLHASAAPRMVALAMLMFAASRHGTTSSFWRDFGGARDVVCAPGDPAPFLAQLPAMCEIAIRAAANRTGLLSASTLDIEWDGRIPGVTG